MSDPTKPVFEINPTLVPKKAAKVNACPKCQSDYTGRRNGMIVLLKCSNAACGFEFSGGPSVTPSDPTRPLPPIDPKDRPLVDQVPTKTNEKGWKEQRRAPSTLQPFRTGAPVPSEED
jgi:hypothetical protein